MADSSGRPNPWLTTAKLAGALLATGVLAAGLALPYVGGLGLAARHETNKFLTTTCGLQESAPPEPSTFYARDGKTVIARIFTQDRQPVPLSRIPKYVQQALIDTEDRRFYQHHGVDMRGLIRSALSTTSGDTQGGSTLTMQYVKQARYYNDIGNLKAQQADISQTLSRKMEDAQCAIQLEKSEPKDTILDNYLNIAFFGENAYSIQSAAQTYFNKDVGELTLPESATLVGLLRAPTQYDPFHHPEAAKTRRNEVLQNMVTVGDLSQAAADRYKAEPIRLATKKPPVVRQGCANATTSIKNAGFFCDYVQQWLDSVEGISASKLQTGGYKIVTTLDAGLQNSVQNNLWKVMPAKSPMTSVLPVVDPKTGDVLAMASNKLFGNPTSDKDTTHTMLANFTLHSAAGASTYKLFSLLTALQTGVPADWKLDTYNGTGADAASYVPQNCYGATKKTSTVTNGDAKVSYSRNETLQSGTAKSSNTFFVAMDDQLFGCNLAPIVDMAESLGMSYLQHTPEGDKTTIGQDVVAGSSVLPLALGSGLLASPLELAGAYAAVANHGKFNPPAPVLSVTDASGKSLPVKRTPAVQVIARQVAAQAVQVLQGDTAINYGTSFDVFRSWYRNGGSIVAGKTGTAVAGGSKKNEQQNAALWFVGMTPNLVATDAILNPAAPSNPLGSLPHIKDAKHNAYGDYAAQQWLSALGPSLHKQHWNWPSPDAVPGADEVPDITGLDLASAKSRLEDAGFMMKQLDEADGLQCASPVANGDIAFYGPHQALPGTTITVCPSSGVDRLVYVKPKPKPKPTPTPNENPRGPGGGPGPGGPGQPGEPGGGGRGHGGGGGGGNNGGNPPH